KSNSFIKAFASLAWDLQLTLVAEGIETMDQKKSLQTLGYTIGQGFLFSAPLSAIDVIVFLDLSNKMQDDETNTSSIIPKVLKSFTNIEERQTITIGSNRSICDDETTITDENSDSDIMTKPKQKGFYMADKISENIIHCPNCGGKSFKAGPFIFGSDGPMFEIKEFASEALERHYRVKGAKDGVWSYTCDNCGAKMNFRMRISSKEQLMFDSSYETSE
ncbi:MAG: hypothetical protein R6V39_00255, partial [Desulfovibrionales bacterium]